MAMASVRRVVTSKLAMRACAETEELRALRRKFRGGTFSCIANLSSVSEQGVCGEGVFAIGPCLEIPESMQSVEKQGESDHFSCRDSEMCGGVSVQDRFCWKTLSHCPIS